MQRLTVTVVAEAGSGAAPTVFTSASTAVVDAVERLRSRFGTGPTSGGIGLAAGEATETPGGWTGPVLDEAMRLAEQAGPGRILASPVVVALATLPPGVESLEVATDTGGSPAVALLVSMASSAGTEPPVADDGPPPLPATVAHADPRPFVGRGDARTIVAAAWEAARQRRRQVVLIAGEPGIGKTRLAIEAARAAHAGGGVVLFGRCDESPQIPYQPFLDAFGQLIEHAPAAELRAHVAAAGSAIARLAPDLLVRVPEAIPPGPDLEGGRPALFDAAADLLARTSERRPVLLAVDDLHWAARPTLLLLNHLTHSAAGRRILLIGTYRDTDLGRTHPFAEVLAELRRQPDVTRLPLGGLSAGEVDELVTAARGEPQPELAAEVHRETNGNPFFAGEVLRHLAEAGAGASLPEGIREVIGNRLSRLSPIANRVLGIAAIMGAEFDASVLSDVDEGSPDEVLDALDEAVRARLVEPPEAGAQRPLGRHRPDCYRFGHALVRATLAEELSAARRVRLHRRVGDAIERRYGDAPEWVDALAYHFAEASPLGDVDRAARFALLASRRAVERAAYEDAIAIADRALSALEDAAGDDRDERISRHRASLLLAQSAAYERLSIDGEDARRTALEAAEAARSAGAGDLLADAVWSFCRYVVFGADQSSSIELAETALRQLPGDDDLHRSRVLSVLSLQRSFGSQRSAGLSLAEESLQRAERTGDVDTLANAVVADGVARWGTPDVAGQRAAAERLFALGIGPERPYLYLFGQRLRATVALLDGDLRAFDECLAEIERLGRRLQYKFCTGLAALWRVTRGILVGDFASAEAALEELAGYLDEPNFMTAWGGMFAALRREQGRIEELLPALDGFLSEAPDVGAVAVGAATMLADAGRTDEARRHYDRFLARGLERIGDDWTTPMTLASLAELAVQFEDRTTAEQLEELSAPFAGLPVVLAGMQVTGAWDRYRGLVSLTLGRTDQAVDRIRLGLAWEERLGARPLIARCHYWLARALLARGHPGDRDDAVGSLAMATRLAEEVGMQRLVEQAQALRERA